MLPDVLQIYAFRMIISSFIGDYIQAKVNTSDHRDFASLATGPCGWFDTYCR
jgi:hypothetical protein